MSNKIQVFDLFNTSNISLTSTGFRKKGDSAKYFSKITDATIVFVGDNSKFETDKKKLFNTLQLKVHHWQEEAIQHYLHHTAQGAIGRVQENPWWDEERESIVFRVWGREPVKSEIESEHEDRE